MIYYNDSWINHFGKKTTKLVLASDGPLRMKRRKEICLPRCPCCTTVFRLWPACPFSRLPCGPRTPHAFIAHLSRSRFAILASQWRFLCESVANHGIGFRGNSWGTIGARVDNHFHNSSPIICYTAMLARSILKISEMFDLCLFCKSYICFSSSSPPRRPTSLATHLRPHPSFLPLSRLPDHEFYAPPVRESLMSHHADLHLCFLYVCKHVWDSIIYLYNRALSSTLATSFKPTIFAFPWYVSWIYGVCCLVVVSHYIWQSCSPLESSISLMEFVTCFFILGYTFKSFALIIQ